MDRAEYRTAQDLHPNYFKGSQPCPQVSNLAYKTIPLPLVASESQFMHNVNLKTSRILKVFLTLAPKAIPQTSC
jgi:hypothetical protein